MDLRARFFMFCSREKKESKKKTDAIIFFAMRAKENASFPQVSPTLRSCFPPFSHRRASCSPCRNGPHQRRLRQWLPLLDYLRFSFAFFIFASESIDPIFSVDFFFFVVFFFRSTAFFSNQNFFLFPCISKKSPHALSSLLL